MPAAVAALEQPGDQEAEFVQDDQRHRHERAAHRVAGRRDDGADDDHDEDDHLLFSGQRPEGNDAGSAPGT